MNGLVGRIITALLASHRAVLVAATMLKPAGIDCVRGPSLPGCCEVARWRQVQPRGIS
jgi:hypothetical protein